MVFLQGNCCETYRSIPKKTSIKEFTKKNSLTRHVFSECLQQLVINREIFDEVAVGSRFALFEVKIHTYL